MSSECLTLNKQVDFKSVQVILLDFDGVVLDSVYAKAEAFKALYEPYGEKIVEKVVAHHLTNGGVSRYEKLSHYHKTFLNINLSVQELEFLAETFSSLVERLVIDSTFVPGIINFLEKYYQTKRIYLISATPQAELFRIVEAKGLTHYFKQVLGSPTSKFDNIASVLKQEKVALEDVVMIGDAATDYEASKKANVGFIARITDYNKNDFPSHVGKIFNFC